MGKRAQAVLEKTERSPQTAEDFLEQGAADEESGDRWFGSDLTKAIRFYQKAYELYLSCMRMAPGKFADSYYNAARLLFHVYNQYVNAEEVDLNSLENVGNATSGNSDSVSQPISVVLRAHEEAMLIAGGSASTDLMYNYACVHTALLEDEDVSPEDILKAGQTAIGLFQQVLIKQVNDLKSFASEIQGIVTQESDSQSTHAGNNGNSGNPLQEEHTSEEVLQPTDVLDTIIASYKLVSAMLEGSVTTSITQAMDMGQPFLSTCDSIASELMSSFSESTNPTPEMISSVDPEMYDEYTVNKAYVNSFAHLHDLELYIAYWNADSLPQMFERYMLAADGLDLFMDAHDLNVEVKEAEKTKLLWKCLTQMNSYYKSAQDLLQAQLQQSSKAPSGVNGGVGTLISQICKVMVARTDIEVQRSQLQFELAQKSQEVLLKNAKTLLKNAMKYAETTGGLRERANEKLQREKRKSEIVMRLCILEQKTSISELDSIMGRLRWIGELPQIVELKFYKKWGVDIIVV